LLGYTGLCSFSARALHRARRLCGAFLTTHAQIRSHRVILVSAAALGALVAVLSRALCVRYVKIYFGMLTLAFGMVFIHVSS